MSQKGIRDWLRDIVPPWLQDRPGANVGFRILFGMAQQLDILLELAIEGVQSWWPGFALGDPTLTLDVTTALPLIGRSRGILRGEAETDASYAARNVRWRETWANAGSAEVLLEEIQAFFVTPPVVRFVDRAGNWTVRDAGGNITTFTAATSAWVWNWDGTSNPERAGFWSDFWLVVELPEWAVRPGTIGSLTVDTEFGIGQLVPRSGRDTIGAILSQWKGAHAWCVAIIWSYDATLFDPTVVNAGNPDGTWGEWGYDKHDGNGIQPVRNASARYWQPANGDS